MHTSPAQLASIEAVAKACLLRPWWLTSKSFREQVTPTTVLSMLKEIAYLQDTVRSFQERGCAGTVPGTWIACGERLGGSDEGQYCSERCYLEARYGKPIWPVGQGPVDQGPVDQGPV